MQSKFRANAQRPSASSKSGPYAMKACLRCRRARIKCGDERPCRQCLKKGQACRDSAEQSPYCIYDRRALVTDATRVESTRASADMNPSIHIDTSALFVDRLDYLIRNAEPEPSESDDSLLKLSPYPIDHKALQNGVEPTLDRASEERLIAAFLDSYQMVAPILSPVWLWKHYNDLWNNSSARRSDSPLVDVLLALAVHQVMSLSGDVGDLDTPNETPGYRHFERSQLGLARSVESSNLETVLSYLYASIYVGHLYQSAKAQQFLALAIRTAQLLGLPCRLQSEYPQLETSMAARTWLALEIMDNVMSTAASLPYLIVTPTNIGAEMPAQDFVHDKANFHGELSRVDCFMQLHRLSELIRSTATVFNEAVEQVVRGVDASNHFYTIISSETTSAALQTSIKSIHVWASSLPTMLRLPLKQTDLISDLNYDIPLWLLRQRGLLRMCYHMACMVLLQLHTLGTNEATRDNPTAAELAVASSKHAIALTKIVHENIGSGLYHVLARATGCQWLALLQLIAYTITHPTDPHSVATKAAVMTAADNILELAAHNVPQAGEALVKVQKLRQVTEQITQQSLANLSGISQSKGLFTEQLADEVPNSGIMPLQWFIDLGGDWESLILESDRGTAAQGDGNTT